MPTTRRRRRRGLRESALHPEIAAFFAGGRWPRSAGFFPEKFGLHSSHDTTLPTLAELWAENRDEILEDWIVEHPGTRPPMWWTHDAPEPRRQLGGGSGLPRSGTSMQLGVPRDWHPTGAPRAWWSSPAFDARNAKTPVYFVDPEDPPVFESQATFLRRLRLLRRGEGARLTAADFAPETLVAWVPPPPSEWDLLVAKAEAEKARAIAEYDARASRAAVESVVG